MWFLLKILLLSYVSFLYHPAFLSFLVSPQPRPRWWWFARSERGRPASHCCGRSQNSPTASSWSTRSSTTRRYHPRGWEQGRAAGGGPEADRPLPRAGQGDAELLHPQGRHHQGHRLRPQARHPLRVPGPSPNLGRLRPLQPGHGGGDWETPWV